MMICGLFGKIGAIFSTIPTPVIGGCWCTLFGVIASVGLANLQVLLLFKFLGLCFQYVNLNSSRNIFVLGFALLMGLAMPSYFTVNPVVIDGASVLTDVFNAILQS